MVCFVSFLSNDVNVTSPYRNPLVQKEIDWTERIVSDFKKYEDDVNEVFPVCGLYNLTTVAVSTLGNFSTLSALQVCKKKEKTLIH